MMNLKQKQAIEALHGPVIIQAGPGTGKTKTLISRIEHLINVAKVLPSQILVLTFTKKAATEIRERLSQNINPTIGTFHSFAYDVLKKTGQIFEMASEKEQKDILESIHEQKETKPLTQREMKDLLLEISIAKNSLESVPSDSFIATYSNHLKLRNLKDYDDLLIDLYNALLKKDPRITAVVNEYTHVLVDEFQDTNKLQYELVKTFCHPNNLFVIGDPFQSIYAFRGADAGIFAAVQRDYPQANCIYLEQNYRSTQHLINLSSVLFPNKIQLEASTKDKKSRAEMIQSVDEFTEASYIVDTINTLMGGTDLLKTQGVEENKTRKFSDFAVMYRTHGMKRSVEQMFFKSGIPYQVIGNESPYEKSEIKLISNILKYISHKNDNTLQDIFESPFFKLASTTIRKIRRLSLEQSISYGHAVHILSTETLLSKSEMKRLSTINNSLKKIVAELQNKKITEIIHNSCSQFDIEIDIHLQQYISTALQYEKSGLSTFVDYVLYLENHEFYDVQSDKVTLMTIHASKGLEFETVFILGFEEGSIPFLKNEEIIQLEEEKRLLYVALTRAKRNIFLTYVQTRYGEPRECSRFFQFMKDTITLIDDPAILREQKKIKKWKEKKSQLQLF